MNKKDLRAKLEKEVSEIEEVIAGQDLSDVYLLEARFKRTFSPKERTRFFEFVRLVNRQCVLDDIVMKHLRDQRRNRRRKGHEKQKAKNS